MFTYDPTREDFPSRVERVRMLLTDRDDYGFADEEIEAQLALEGSVTRAVAALWGIAAGNVRYLEKLFVVRAEETIDIERASAIARARAEALYKEAERAEEAVLTEWPWDPDDRLRAEFP